MLAKTLVNLLPTLSSEEQVAVTKLHSLAGESIDNVITSRPFRSPHHTASRVALIGGGSQSKPGEISLAHLGVLFLDEIPEYPRASLEALRQPLEDKKITVSRASGNAIYPADFMLVATMNPCPCGYYGDQSHECTCSATQILTYQKRLSGPFLDRIDLKVNVSRVPNAALIESSDTTNKQHLEARKGIDRALVQQANRYKSSAIYNSNLTSSSIKKTINLTADVRNLLAVATEKLGLSARAYFKVIKVARTIADLEGSPIILVKHVSEALQYR